MTYLKLSPRLAGRLKKVIGGLIDTNQSAFIKGRFILDNYVAEYDCIHEQKKKKECLDFKIDFEKAYDRVN